MESPLDTLHVCSCAKVPYSNLDLRSNNMGPTEAGIRTTKDLPTTESIIAEGQLVESANGLAMTSTPEEEVAPTDELERLTLAESEGTSQTPTPEVTSDCISGIADVPRPIGVSGFQDYLSTKTLIIPNSRQCDSSKNPKPLSKFTPFPKLPTELRLKIWKLAMPMRRPVLIRTAWNPEANMPRDSTHRNDTLSCTVSTITKDSSAFRACKESWSVAQDMTELIYDEKSSLDNKTGGFKTRALGQLKMRCEFKNNMVIIGRHGIPRFEYIANQFILQSVRHLVLCTKLLFRASHVAKVCDSVKRHCPNLKKLIFTIGAGLTTKSKEDPEHLHCIRIDSNLTDLIHFWAQRSARGDILVEYLKLLVKADRCRTRYQAWVTEFAPEWKRLDFDVCMLVRKRKSGFLGWLVRWDASPPQK